MFNGTHFYGVYEKIGFLSCACYFKFPPKEKISSLMFIIEKTVFQETADKVEINKIEQKRIK